MEPGACTYTVLRPRCSDTSCRSLLITGRTDVREYRTLTSQASFTVRLLGGKKLVMLCVDGFIIYNFLRIFRKKSDTAEGLRSIINEKIIPQGLQIGIIRMGGGGEFDG